MVKLLIIADDFTGALDTGVQFAKLGIETQVYTDTKLHKTAISPTAQVLVVDSETRPLSKEDSYEIVKNIVEKAVKLEIPTIFKKTDSALRGNVGSELAAALDGTKERELFFFPAFPDIQRITKEGIHYINGELLEDSAFGKDPFEPVTCSSVSEIIGKQTRYPVVTVSEEAELSNQESSSKTIYVFDATTTKTMFDKVEKLKRSGKLKLVAGCAGVASCLPYILELKSQEPRQAKRTEGLYIACGSLNPITKKQVEDACLAGFARVNLRPEQKLCPAYYASQEGERFLNDLSLLCNQEKTVLVDTFDLEDKNQTITFAEKNQIPVERIRFLISKCHGKIVKSVMKDKDFTILMTGGDTLMGFMKEIGSNQLQPVCEIGQGAVLSRLFWDGREVQVISKSGGYGETDIFTKIKQTVLIGGEQ